MRVRFRICCRAVPRIVRPPRYPEREKKRSGSVVSEGGGRMPDQPAEPGWLSDGPEPCEPADAEAGWAWDEGSEPREPTDAELFGLWPDPFAGPPDDPDVRRDLADG